MPAPVLQFKRGNAGVAGTVPALRPGEPAISLNNFDFFIGIDTSVANNKFFGSHRYWGREDGTTSLRLKLVDKTGVGGTIALKTPDDHTGVTTYTFPSTPVNGKVLSTNGSGQLSWVDQVNTLGVEAIVIGIGTFTNNVAFTTTTASTSSTTGGVVITGGLGVGGTSYFGDDVNVDGNLSAAGIVTFTDTTDNTLGDVNTGAVQIDGGVGIAKNLTVGAGLSVIGQSYFIGTATFYGGQLNLGDSDTDNINVAGEFISNLVPNQTNTYDLGLSGKRWRNAFYSGNVDITGDLNVDGNVTIGGTAVTLLGQDVYIQNKDIILGYTTSIGGVDISTDDTANHAGVAIASTIGTPLVPFAASGINTLPDTYKQMMWFKQGTLGFGTDAFAFNYGVAIGTTTMANGVRLAVGSNVTITDTAVTATTFNGSLSGNASSADQVKTVTAGDAAAVHYLTFVNSHNGSATNETVYTDDGIYYNPGTNKLTTQHAEFTGDVFVGAGLSVVGVTTFANYINANSGINVSGATTVTSLNATGSVTLGDNTSDTLTVNANATFNGTVSFNNASLTGTISTAARAQSVDVVGVATNQNYYLTLVDGSGNSKSLGVDAELLYNPNTNTFTVGTGVGITQFSASVSTGSSASSVPTSKAIIDYVGSQVGNVDLTLSLAGDNGTTGSVNTSQTFTISGTPNEVDTAVSGQTVTIGLPNDVVVGTSLSSPTIRTGTIQSSNTGQTVLTLTGNSATFANDLTVNGNLYVEGSTTQINTTTLQVEDRTIELGRFGIDAQPQPTTTTWDLAVLFNYGDAGTAKKAGVVWEASGATKRFQFTTDVNPGSDGSDTQTNLPSFTVSNFAPIEIGQLWVTDCAGTSQVISCTGTERFLENITVDAGTF